MLRTAFLALTLSIACHASAQEPAFRDVSQRSHALQLGLGEISNGYWYPVPALRGDFTWLRRYDRTHAYFLRLEGGASLADRGGDAPTRSERAYTSTLLLGVREWLGQRRRGFVEVGIRLGLVYVTGRLRDDSLDVYFAKELLTVGAGVALGKHHDVDLLFSTGWGFPSGGGVALRVPLWHRFQ